MKQAQKGDRVRIHYVGSIEDGTVIDTSYPHEHDHDHDDSGCGCETGPVELVVGEDEFLPMIEEALVGMTPGDRKKVVIATDDAFGDYDPEKVVAVERGQFPEGFELHVGQGLELTDEEGESFEVLVVEVEGDQVTLDLNHPLAGESITYEVELLEIL